MNDLEKLSDEEVVEMVRSNDQELFSVIVLRYQDKLLRYANVLIKDADKASDIVQDSFIKAFINLNGFNTKKKFSSWIYRIVHNESINIVKKYSKEMSIINGIDFQSEENVEVNFDKKEIIVKVKKCLNNIPILYSEPLTLFFLEEKSYEEISDILRIPMGTVAVRINRGKILMKKIC